MTCPSCRKQTTLNPKTLGVALRDVCKEHKKEVTADLAAATKAMRGAEA
jgi:predicted amino acid dehydrogenase